MFESLVELNWLMYGCIDVLDGSKDDEIDDKFV